MTKLWIKGNKLKMNDDETELISIASKSKLKQVSTNSMVSQDCEIAFSESLRNLGVFLDESFSREMPVKQLYTVLYFQLRRISKIRSFLTADAANTLAVAFILSRLDYCNSLFFWLAFLIINLQSFNAYRKVLPDSSFVNHGVKALLHLRRFLTGCLLKLG